MALLTDLKTLLEDEGITTTIARGRLPDNPDDVIAIQTFAGTPSRLHGVDYIPADERLDVQVTIRALYQGQAETIARAVFDAIQFRNRTLDSGRRYHYVRAPQYPAYIGVDDRDRHIVGFTAEVRRWRDADV